MPAGAGQLEPQIVARLGHRDVQPLPVDPDGDGEVLAGDRLGDEVERLGLRRVATEVGDGHAEEVGQRVDEAALVEGAHVDEHLAEALPGAGLLLQRGRDLGVGHEAAGDEDLSEQAPRPPGRSTVVPHRGFAHRFGHEGPP